MRESKYSHLEIISVTSALEAMRQARPLGFAHPLTQFICLRQATVQLEGKAAADAVIFRALAAIIRHRLNRLRRVCSLPETSRQDDGAAVRDDFRANNTELEAWSLLYYRYVRVDLDLSIESLAESVQQSERTLNRRQRAGIARLTYELARREMRFRKQQQTTILRAQLPYPYAPALIGRDSLLELIEERLTAAELPRHLLLYGAPGIGKSALALAAAHRLIERLHVQNVVWIDHPEPIPERLTEALALHLGMPLNLENHPSLTSYLQVVNSLIVLDEADALVADSAALARALAMLGPARLLIGANIPPHNPPMNLAQLEVPELDHESALRFLELQALNDLGRSEQLYRDLGGNPGALRMGLAMGRRYRSSQISANFYETIWEATPATGRATWLTLALRPRPVSDAMLADLLPDMAAPELQTALTYLEVKSVVDHVQDAWALTPLARTFAGRVMRESTAHDLAQAAVQRAADHLTQHASGQDEIDVAACLYLLEQARQAALAARFLLDLAYSLGPVVERAGAWLVWQRYLEPLYDILPGALMADRLWVRLRLGIAFRWLARWADATYALSAVMEEAGAAGLFEMQAEAMIELVAVYRYRKEYAVADQLLSRAAEFYARGQQNEGYQRVIAARLQIALDNGDLDGAEAYLSAAGVAVTSDKLRDLSPRLLMLAAEFALRRKAPQDALRFAEAARHGFQGDLPRLARLATLMGRIHHQLGDWRGAVDFMTWAIASMGETQDMLGHARARLNLALMFMAQGKLRAALRYLRDLPADLEHLGDTDSLQVALHNLELIKRALNK